MISKNDMPRRSFFGAVAALLGGLPFLGRKSTYTCLLANREWSPREVADLYRLNRPPPLRVTKLVQLQGRWHHVNIVFDPRARKTIYIDGRKVQL